jgi:hypothetical protein
MIANNSIMSDSESDISCSNNPCSSNNSLSTLCSSDSIHDELDFDFADVVGLHEALVENSETIIHTLQSIMPRIGMEKVVMIKYDDKSMPLSEFLEELHMKSMESIMVDGKMAFGESLLSALETATICH